MARRIITKGSKKGAGQALGISIEGIDEIIARATDLSSKNQAFARDVKELSIAAATMVRDEARDLVPVRTGLLKSAIFAAGGDPGKSDALAGVNQRKAPHAYLVEHGTSKMKARPYMRPAVTYSRSGVTAVVIDGFRRLLDKYTK